MNDPTTDEAYLWPTRSLTSLQDAINEDVKRLAQITAAPALFKERPAPCSGYEASDDRFHANRIAVRRRPEYDDSWLAETMPMRFVLGVDPGDIDPEFLRVDALLRQDPEPLTIEAHGVSLEVLEIMLGAPLIPLCRREIPAEGTE